MYTGDVLIEHLPKLMIAVCLLVFQHHSPSHLILQGPPVDNVPWGEVQVTHVALDLTSGEDVVPHMDVRHHSNERLARIKTPSVRVLFLTEDDDWGFVHVHGVGEFPGAGFAVLPQLRQPSVGLPGGAHGMPGVESVLLAQVNSLLVIHPKVGPICVL